jgi:hypothetical protein
MIKHLIKGIWTTFFRSVKVTEKDKFYHKQNLQPVRALFYSLTFEKTALCEKSTFQPPVMFKNSGFGLAKVNKYSFNDIL